VEQIMLATVDPEPRMLDGQPTTLPALTSMMFRVCQNDETRFLEACRLIELFIEQALAGRGPRAPG
jgi:hypothetical protein